MQTAASLLSLSVSEQASRSYYYFFFVGGDNKPEVCVDNGPKFTIQPMGVSVKVSSSFTLSCLAFGSPAPTYQWTFNGKV